LGGALIERGVLVDDDPREPWFLSYSHDAAVVQETLQIVEDAARSVFGGHAARRSAA
jgi:glutamate-1-semialdehyde aminotransferase